MTENEPDQVAPKEEPLDHNDLHSIDEVRISQERAILRRAAEEIANRRAQAQERALARPPSFVGEDSFRLAAQSLQDTSADIRNATTRKLFDLDPSRATSLFNQALLENTADRRREIGAALAGSGLAAEALDAVASNVDEQNYQAFALLFLLAKAGEVKPSVDVIEAHLRIDVRIAVIKLLEMSGESDVVPLFRRLTESSGLPNEVYNAMIGAIGRMGGEHTTSPQ